MSLKFPSIFVRSSLPAMTADFRSLLRQPPARLPDFLGLGAQRAGTTMLHLLLLKHPEVFVPDIKEVQYFSLYYHYKLRWYARYFVRADANYRVGEISPYYLFHPEVPRRIATVLPNARLVVLLRDPVERALSGYFHARRHGMESLPIEEAFHTEPKRLHGAASALAPDHGQHYAHRWHSYLARSRYEEQIARYYSLFPHEQLLLLRSEDLFSDPQSAWARIQGFLGLSVLTTAEPLPPSNRATHGGLTIPSSLRVWIRTMLEPTYAAMRQDYGIIWP